MDKKYSPGNVEKGKYEFWKTSGFFKSGDNEKEPYSIVIPPPNVTGVLHLGHALDNSMQDLVIRRKRMQGFDALFLPGMDHAGIATQAKVDEKLMESGTNRFDIGRDEFMKKAWDWTEEHSSIIREQWAALGLSVDYDKERFTLDEGLNKAVNKVFVDLYNKGIIYRGEKIINWDPKAKTALSNIEVDHKEIEGKLYHLVYFRDDDNKSHIKDPTNKTSLIVATTRPETIFADVALMVNPNDERYKDFMGFSYRIPGTDKSIPIITDEAVDMEFGTGVVKVTPAHDPTDFEVGKTYDLEMPSCLNEDGTMNHMAGNLEGLDRFEAREKLASRLNKIGSLVKVEKHKHNVGHSERTGVIVEPRLSKQWFVKMEDLSQNALDLSTVEFIPERFDKTFRDWMDNVYDWCISRQLWWGHRIPAWYKGDQIKVQENSPGKGWVQDEDVLDTWFSSALWPFSTLGWPEKTDDLERYFPTNLMVTGYDIIFFWVSRMIFQSIEFMDTVPFNQCLIHGLIRAEDGRKMSKSLGNGVDPLAIKEKYGADTLRYFLLSNGSKGQDLRFDIEKVESSWNYINKIWNISRYILMRTDVDLDIEDLDYSKLHISDKWILSELQSLIRSVDDKLENFDFVGASKDMYLFTWEKFASWYLEISKVSNQTESKDFVEGNKRSKENTDKILVYTLKVLLKLIHPYMPFVTEDIYSRIKTEDKSIMISKWPEVKREFESLKDIEDFNRVRNFIKHIRNMRSENNIDIRDKISMIIDTEDLELANLLKLNISILSKFVNSDNILILENKDSSKQDSRQIVSTVENSKIYISYDNSKQKENELEKLKKDIEKTNNEIKRCENMLGNKNFLKKANKQKIKSERNKLDKHNKNKKILEDRLAELEG